MAYLLIIGAVILRILPHIPNFAPITAIALFGSVYLNKKYALVIPIIAMLISDIIIGFPEFWVSVSIYASFILIGLLGFWLRKNKNIFNIIGVTLTSSLSFFIITNFAVWAATPWYGKNLTGLLQCYYMAIPFFRNTMLGDIFYVGAMFGIYEFINYYIARRYEWKKVKF
jgi:hypothetical protein